MELKVENQEAGLGTVPDGWEASHLGAIATIKRGASPRPIDDPKWFGGQIGWVRISDVTSSQVYLTKTTDYLSYEGVVHSVRIYPGELIMSIAATVGLPAISAIDACIHDGFVVFRKLDVRVNALFLYYYLRYSSAIFSDAGQTGSQKNINSAIVGNTLIAVPPLPEQRAIAAALSDVDALIQALDRLIAKKRDIKQGAMQELLTGKRRLPGFSGEWETRELGEVVEIVSGGTPRVGIRAYWDGNIPWCTPTDVTATAGKYLIGTERSITSDGLKHSSAQLLPSGTLLLCSRATIGEIKIATKLVATNQGFKSLICGLHVHNEFLYYLLLTMKSQMLEKAIGSTFLEISKKDTSSLIITLPDLQEQKAIATVLSDLDTEIDALEQKRDKTIALKQGMMQELLTGKTRLL